jgi:hypothetical protein
MPRKCCIESCVLPVKAKGLCQAHYVRSLRGLDLSKPLTRTGTDKQRLKAKMRINPMTGCWEWMASVNTNGYGQFRINGTTEQAHRASWMIFRGPIPADGSAYGTVNVLHRCDNSLCVNPEHLFLGNQSENAKDAVKKGRWGQRGVPGQFHGRAVLTDNAVRQIRASLDSVETLAQKHKVSGSTICHVRKRRTWKHI